MRFPQVQAGRGRHIYCLRLKKKKGKLKKKQYNNGGHSNFSIAKVKLTTGFVNEI